MGYYLLCSLRTFVIYAVCGLKRWDRDVTVRSFAWLYKACQDCVERWQKRQNTLQMYQTFHEQRSRSGSHSRERDRNPALLLL